MTRSGSKTPSVVGRMIAHLVPFALMLWAASATSGVLRWCLLAWCAFLVLVWAGMSALKNLDGEVK